MTSHLSSWMLWTSYKLRVLLWHFIIALFYHCFTVSVFSPLLLFFFPKSCLTVWDIMGCIPPGSCVHGILQARIVEWGAISFPGDLPETGMESTSTALAGSLPLRHLGSWISTQVSWIAGKFFTYFIINDVKWQNGNVHSRAKKDLKNECTQQSLDMTVVASSIVHHCVFNIKKCVLNGKDKVKGSLFLILWIVSEKILFCCWLLKVLDGSHFRIKW